MIWIQFGILLIAVLIGSRMKSIGLGVMGMVGLLLFLVVFRMRPADPPLDVSQGAGRTGTMSDQAPGSADHVRAVTGETISPSALIGNSSPLTVTVLPRT